MWSGSNRNHNGELLKVLKRDIKFICHNKSVNVAFRRISGLYVIARKFRVKPLRYGVYMHTCYIAKSCETL